MRFGKSPCKSYVSQRQCSIARLVETCDHPIIQDVQRSATQDGQKANVWDDFVLGDGIAMDSPV
jgi:hypothetical protein